MLQKLYPPVLLAALTLLSLYVISIAWMYLALSIVVQQLLNRNIILEEQYDTSAFLGVPFNLLVLLLTILATIAGVMIAKKVFPKLSKVSLTKKSLVHATAFFAIGLYILLSDNGALVSDIYYGYGWLMAVLWVALPTLAFFVSARKQFNLA